LIHEIAEIDVKPGTEAQFEAGVAQAAPLFRAAKGCLAMELHRSIEQPSRYRLLVRWETVENHTVDFRQSEAFQQWRALVGPYLASPPRVEHVSRVVHGF
jgi:quinol monooxygenase YgiN